MALSPAIRGTRGNQYCGPAAIASALGVSVDAAAAAIRAVTGKASVHGVMTGVLIEAIESVIGGTAETLEEIKHEDGLMRPFHGSLERLGPLLGAGHLVIAFNNHYVAYDAERREVCDNHTIYPLALYRYRLRRKRVVGFWLVEKKVVDTNPRR